ncbi:MAG: hypothetical protein ACHQ7N_14580 [Candidatus Methylomirabilales bacterium]
MRIKDLKRTYGSAVVSAWPPMWTSVQSAHGPWSTRLAGDEGVLERANQLGDRLTLTMRSNNGEHAGSLQWDEPPTVVEVEEVLMAHLGEPIRNVGDLEV